MTTQLDLVYDDGCAFCVRCAAAVAQRRTRIPMRLLPMSQPEARARFATLPWFGRDLLVADEHGNVWLGHAAYLMVLWAIDGGALWAHRLASHRAVPVTAALLSALENRRPGERRDARWIVEGDACEAGCAPAATVAEPELAR